MSQEYEPSAQFSLKDPVHFLALGFGSGLLKPAPGTWGTLAAIPIYLVLAQMMLLSNAVYVPICLGVGLLGIYLCGKAAHDIGVHDHGAIVWDEIAGFLVTMIAIAPTSVNIVAGFLLFRLLDIVKPWPIAWFDKQVDGGLGIMLDDLIAGLFACAILHFIQPWLPPTF